MTIKLSRDEVLNLEYSFKKEYLLTNGCGSYASSTILDCHTRKYHGLLVVPNYKTGKLFNLLSKVEVSVEINKKDFHLSTNKFPGVFSPTGHQYVEKFELDDMPVTTYKIGDIVIVKTIQMPQGLESVLIKYEVKEGSVPLVFKMSPLLAYRDMHALSHENMHIRPRSYFEKGGFKIDPYEGMPPLYLETSETATFYPSPSWWRGFEYLKERNRGYPYQEDLFCPGIFELKLKKGDKFILRATTNKSRGDINKEWAGGVKALKEVAKSAAKDKEPLKSLKKQAAHYLVQYPNKQAGIRAGYPWCLEYGRDTFMALPGLLLYGNETETALSLFRRYSRYEKSGVLPNELSINGHQDYHNADIALWYILAVQRYLTHTGDRKGVEKDILKTLTSILSAYLDAKVPLCGVDGNGILFAGNSDTRLTWMNAQAFGRPVTPRGGAPVELNALFYNALRFVSETFSKKLGPETYGRFRKAADLLAKNFERLFWNGSEQCLFDVVHADGSHDAAVRPNQLFACGLPFPLLEKARATKVIESVNRHLLTSYGLRSLSPESLLYKPLYGGNIDKRESAAHQGMIYPWFIGIYTDTLLSVYPKKVVKSHVENSFGDLISDHLQKYGLFQISEMFTPNPPHIAKGTMGQACNLAEIIRTLETLKK